MMNKSNMVQNLKDKMNLSEKDAKQAVDIVFSSISDSLKNNERTTISGFGTFEIRERAARKGRNPQTGEEITISSRKLPAFKPSKPLKDYFKDRQAT